MAGGSAVVGSAALALVTEASPLQVADSLFESMVSGWQEQQRSRRLGESIIGSRRQTVRRFVEFTGRWPWEWAPGQLESWISASSWAHSTVRAYQGAIAAFLDYVCDPRYGWVSECEQHVGARPVQICHEGNTAKHVADYEGRPGRRALTREELQALFDAADDAVGKVIDSGRKGWLAAFRDATLFKVCYAFGLRRREVAMLDVSDFAANPAAPELGGLGVCQVRFGKAMRGSPPRRRAVAAVMPWAVEALEQYLEQVRPRYAAAAHPALWLTERGGRISARQVDDRFALWRKTAGLPAELSVHCLRHSYISHLIESGVDPLFVQQQVGHSWASTTAVYTHVGSDAKNRMLRAALSVAFDAERVRS
jgi:site-specific recombinase XerD